MISSLLIYLISLSIVTVTPDFSTTTCRSSSSCLASRLNGRSEHIEKSRVHHSLCHMAGIYNQSMISNYIGRGLVHTIVEWLYDVSWWIKWFISAMRCRQDNNPPH